MSLFDRLRNEDGTDDDEPVADEPAETDGGDDPFGDDLDDGTFDDEEFDDEMLFDEDSEEYANEELEGRVNELETEITSLSSTVNTIRSENEEISETVESVEENVRKLLDVYEMVTRGINPFTDDVEAGGQAGSLGLFGADADDEADDELDEDVASAGADEKPYLRGLPNGYVADLLVLEWLEYLVDAGGRSAAEGAIDYYETIRWVDEDGADRLRSFMEGFHEELDEEHERLTVSHHTQSLRYVCQLSSSASAPVVLDGWNDGPGRFER